MAREWAATENERDAARKRRALMERRRAVDSVRRRSKPARGVKM
jgi:hypothetical protein